MNLEAMRSAFESWGLDYFNYGFRVERNAEGDYEHDGTDTAWCAWQAALASQATPAREVGAEPVAWLKFCSTASLAKNSRPVRKPWVCDYWSGAARPECTEDTDRLYWRPVYTTPPSPPVGRQEAIPCGPLCGDPKACEVNGCAKAALEAQEKTSETTSPKYCPCGTFNCQSGEWLAAAPTPPERAQPEKFVDPLLANEPPLPAVSVLAELVAALDAQKNFNSNHVRADDLLASIAALRRRVDAAVTAAREVMKEKS